jgi:uncharacterized protein
MHKRIPTICMAFAALLLSVTVASGAHADEKSHRASIQEFFKIAQMDTLIQRSMDAALNSQIQVNPQLKPYEPKMRQFFNKYMSWKSLQDDFTTIYMKAFTEDEFKQLLAFYKTPVGKKSLQEMPTLMEQGAAIGVKRVQEHMPELQKMLEEGAPKTAQPRPAGSAAPKAAH